MEGPTSGTEVLDALIDQVRIGDNLVVQGDDGALLDLIVERFITANLPEAPLVVICVAAPWEGAVPEGMTVLDWSAPLTGEPSPHPDALPPGADLEAALAQLRATDEQVGTGAAFVFDRLTAVQRAFGEDAGLALFLAACPRLYRRRSLALWPVESDQHRPTFLRRLTEVTQVVVEVAGAEGSDEPAARSLTVRKADGRDDQVIGRRLLVRRDGDDLVSSDEPVSTREQLGASIRDQRLRAERSQAELARQVGISPSALSQVERGVRGLSGETLIRLWEALGVPFGPSSTVEPAGYRISRRSAREPVDLQPGLVGERLITDEGVGEVWLLRAEPGSSGDHAPFTAKVTEVVTVVRGVLELRIGSRLETLHEGDAFVSTSAPVAGWSNPGDQTAEVLWSLQAR